MNNNLPQHDEEVTKVEGIDHMENLRKLDKLLSKVTDESKIVRLELDTKHVYCHSCKKLMENTDK